MRAGAGSVAAAGLVGCDACQLLCRPADASRPGFCPRCGEQLRFRRKHSAQIAWSLVIAAAICYLPANFLPVLTTHSLGVAEDDTIIGGVLMLYRSGSWPLALIVLVASVVIPIGKIISVAYLLIKLQQRGSTGVHEQAKLYRLIEFIGRWSMLDVFVDAYTVALVQLQPLMSVAPGPGVLFFAAVVVLTMLAVEYLDPRLIWDRTDDMRAADAC